MPTSHRRHAVTETPPVREALDELRAALGAERLEISELVILGARTKLESLRSERTRQDQLLMRLVDRVRGRQVPADPALADEVRRTGWARG
jgi:hypothetical protein